MVASSFGKMVMADNPHDGLKEEDLAIALLMMITNNIGQVTTLLSLLPSRPYGICISVSLCPQVAYLNARLHNCSRIFFVGNFLRHNKISCRRLAFAINFWSSGTMEAFFLEHEGYFGALGAFLESAFGDRIDEVLLSSAKKYGDLNDKESEGEALRFVSNSKQRKNSVSVPVAPLSTAASSVPSSTEETSPAQPIPALGGPPPSPSPTVLLPSSSPPSPSPGLVNESPPKKKNWRELFQSHHSENPSLLPLRRLRTQSLDSHDMNLSPKPATSSTSIAGTPLPALFSPQSSE
jgi:hypothetical protein